jgi:hypothetical protein
MRHTKLAVAGAIAATALLPSTALAELAPPTIGDVQLGPEGATATTDVTVTCPVDSSSSLQLNLAQNNGGRLSAGGTWQPVVCTGAPQTVSMQVGFSIFALKQGKASATVTLYSYDPVGMVQDSATTGPITVRVHK